MIQPLRRVHRRAFFILAFLAPLILLAALLARRDPTPPNSWRLP